MKTKPFLIHLFLVGLLMTCLTSISVQAAEKISSLDSFTSNLKIQKTAPPATTPITVSTPGQKSISSADIELSEISDTALPLQKFETINSPAIQNPLDFDVQKPNIPTIKTSLQMPKMTASNMPREKPGQATNQSQKPKNFIDRIIHEWRTYGILIVVLLIVILAGIIIRKDHQIDDLKNADLLKQSTASPAKDPDTTKRDIWKEDFF